MALVTHERIYGEYWCTISQQPTHVARGRPQLLHADAAEPGTTVGLQPAHSASPDHSDREDLDISADLEETLAHRDERQIGLDTNRSFVLYPVGD